MRTVRRDLDARVLAGDVFVDYSEWSPLVLVHGVTPPTNLADELSRKLVLLQSLQLKKLDAMHDLLLRASQNDELTSKQLYGTEREMVGEERAKMSELFKEAINAYFNAPRSCAGMRERGGVNIGCICENDEWGCSDAVGC